MAEMDWTRLPQRLKKQKGLEEEKEQLNLLNHSQNEFEDIKKRLEEPKCEANITFDKFQQTSQITSDICDKNSTINIKKQAIQDLQFYNVCTLIF